MSRVKLPRSLASLALVAFATAANGWVSVFPTGVTVLDQTQVDPGAVIFNANTGQSYAISVNGGLLAAWDSPDPLFPLMGYTEPLDGGTILAYISDGPKPGCAVNCGDRIVEMDTAGNVVWGYVDTEDRFLHHDFERLSNGNTMILCSKEFTDLNVSDKPIIDDCIVEVDPAGNVVWEWQTADHYDELGLTDEERDLIFERGGDWGHANGAGVIPDNVSLPAPFTPGDVFIQYQDANMLIIVDRETSAVNWTLKDVAISPHGSNFLGDDVDGSGHLLVFDNGAPAGYPTTFRNYSRVIEIDPTDSSIQWEYTALDSGATQIWAMYSHFKGMAQRLPNGNTMITEGSSGRLFEINTDGDIVWEFVMPVDTGGRDIYRAFKVAPDWASFGN